jgi:hypothetical protein
MKTVEFYTTETAIEIAADDDFDYPQLPDWCSTPVNDYVGGAYISDEDADGLRHH